MTTDQFEPFERFVAERSRAGKSIVALTAREIFREAYMRALRDAGVRYGKPPSATLFVIDEASSLDLVR